MPLPSKEQQLESVCSELHKLSLRRQQLTDRLDLLGMLKKFGKNVGFQEEGEDSTKEEESEKIAAELKKLMERKRELQAKKDALEYNHVQLTGGTFSPAPLDGPDTPTSFGSQIFYVDKPPSYPAPQVILDVQKLPPRASQTQCPFCEQYITTEISTVTGNTTWLVCMVCTFICCIAGCCLVPFCTDSFKDIVHKCPKCRSQIHTCKKM